MGETSGNRHHPSSTTKQDAEAHDPRCVVITYHYIRQADPKWQEGVKGVTPTAFAEQVDRLCALMEPITWQELYAWLAGEGTIPQRCFLLTFEDGLSDHARVAAPMLEDRGLRGVFFMPGAVLATEEMLPAHAIHLLLTAHGDEWLERNLRDILEENHGWRAPRDDSDTGHARRMYLYETPVRASLKYLLTMRLPIAVRNSAIRTLFERHIGASRDWSKRWYVGWKDLTAMRSRGHTIGGQGYSLEPLLRLPDRRRRSDIQGVAAILRSGLGPAARPFAYPYGGFDSDTAAICRQAGFAQAFTTRQGRVTPASDAMSLPRVDAKDLAVILNEESEPQPA